MHRFEGVILHDGSCDLLGSSKQLEKRRRRAVQLLESGRSLSAVARQVGATVSSVFRWRQAYQRKGAHGLDAKPIPGRPPRLSAAQRRRLVTLLGQGALHAGYRTELWTLPRVAELIRDEFGVRYHPAHVWKLLTALGWSCQKPERRAVERDEAAIARWKREDWPRIKKRRSTGRPSRLRR
jgi:transposase